MEEVPCRLADALLQVGSNKGAPGPDDQTIETLLERWPGRDPLWHGWDIGTAMRSWVLVTAIPTSGPRTGYRPALLNEVGFHDAGVVERRDVIEDERCHVPARVPGGT